MKNTPVKVSTCTRCGKYVFACLVDGVKSAVDVSPLDVEEYRSAVLSGRSTYDQLTQAGRPWKLQMRGPWSSWPPKHTLLGEHTCGTRGMNTKVVEVLELPPHLPRAQYEAYGELAAMSTRVETVTYLPSDTHYKRCERCEKILGKDNRIVGVKVGDYWEWVQHDYDCREET